MRILLTIAAITLTSGSTMAVFEILHDDFNIARLSSAASMVSLGRYEDELAEDPADGPWLEKGDLLLALGDYEEAAKCYDKALEQDKAEHNSALTLYAANGKGLALIYLGKYDETIDSLNQALANADDEPIPVEFIGGPYLHNTLGVARYHKGEYGKAFYHFNVAYNYISDEVKSLVAYNCAAAFAHLDNTEMMLPYVEEFCRLSPGSVAAGRIFEKGEAIPVDIDLAERAKRDEAFEDYWEYPEFLEIVGE
jgi:tetratricopeptide (TPR) repeat protein